MQQPPTQQPPTQQHPLFLPQQNQTTRTFIPPPAGSAPLQLQMEERSPPDGKLIINNPPAHSTSNLITKETYVIQFPRNQVYRVPPPEHALIVKHHILNGPSNQNKNISGGCRLVCWAIAASILLIIIFGIAMAIIRGTLYAPKAPIMRVTNIRTRNMERSPEYEMRLRANNPSERMSMAFGGDDGGEYSSLIFNEGIIGKGGVRGRVKGGPRSNVDVPVVFSGRGVSVSDEDMESLNEAREKGMSLKIVVPFQVNSWARNEKMDLTITCDFKVLNLVRRNSRITSQHCTAGF